MKTLGKDGDSRFTGAIGFGPFKPVTAKDAGKEPADKEAEKPDENKEE